MFNQIYNQEFSHRQSGADDVMVLKTVKERYKNMIGGSKFKRFHWWEAARRQPKWRAKSDVSFTLDPWISSSNHTTKDEVTRPMGEDRANAVVRKGNRYY
jgi:hypothetical protein